jgi:hypothetical protein
MTTLLQIFYKLSWDIGNLWKSCISPLMTKAKKCSDWAKNLTTDSSRYSTNLSFQPHIFHLTLLENYHVKYVFNIQIFLIVLF